MITAVESYDPKSTDFAEEIKKMIGLFYPRPTADREEEEQSEQKIEEPEMEAEGQVEEQEFMGKVV